MSVKLEWSEFVFPRWSLLPSSYKRRTLFALVAWFTPFFLITLATFLIRQKRYGVPIDFASIGMACAWGGVGSTLRVLMELLPRFISVAGPQLRIHHTGVQESWVNVRAFVRIGGNEKYDLVEASGTSGRNGAWVKEILVAPTELGLERYLARCAPEAGQPDVLTMAMIGDSGIARRIEKNMGLRRWWQRIDELAVVGLIVLAASIFMVLLASHDLNHLTNDIINVRSIVNTDVPLQSTKQFVRDYLDKYFVTSREVIEENCIVARYTTYEGRQNRKVTGSIRMYFYFDANERLNRIEYDNSKEERPLLTPYEVKSGRQPTPDDSKS